MSADADLFSLDGKSAVVVGGSGGLGQGIAEGFARYGASVAIAARNPAALERAAEEIESQTGRRVASHRVDCRDERSVKELAERTVSDFGRVDILINAQGYNFKAPALEFPMEQWDQLFETNVRGVMLCAKAFGAHMVHRGEGRIINLSSVRGQRAGSGGNSAYCASKGATDMLTRQLACEFAPHNVLVNAIGPIITVTQMTRERIERERDRYDRMLQNVPMGRMATTADVVGPAVFLASKAASFVTGSIIYVDGGMMTYA